VEKHTRYDPAAGSPSAAEETIYRLVKRAELPGFRGRRHIALQDGGHRPPDQRAEGSLPG